MPAKSKNYNYVSDNAVIIITAKTEPEAEGILKDIVKYPLNFRLEHVNVVE